MAQELRYTAEGYPYYENVDLNWVDRTNPTIIDAAPNDAFETAAARIKGANKRLPVQGQVIEKPTSYIMEPDLLETQGGMRLPTDVGQSDAGFFNINTGKELPVIRRPNVWPIVNTPDGPTFAMPKVLDVVGNVMSPLAAGRVPVKAGEMVLGSGAVRTMAEESGPFFSSLERAVENAKMGKGDANQWLGYLRNQPGVKPEELQYVLNELPQGPIGKEQLKELVKANKVELKETYKGRLTNRLASDIRGTLTDDLIDNLKTVEDIALAKKHNANFKESVKGYSDAEILKAAEEAKSYKGFGAKTKYHSYQLPGGENYKEMLLQLPAQRAKVEYKIVPNKDGVNFDVIRNIDGVKEDYLRAVPRNEAEDAAKYGNTMDTSANRYSANTYKSSHWDEPNVLAHVRMNDRMVDGKKTLHIEEWQSDLHQAGRDYGYKGELKKLEPEFNKIEQKIIDSGDETVMGNPNLKNALAIAVDKKIITKEEAQTYERFSKVEAGEAAGKTVPDFPFKKNWDELALKRMLHKAANEGYEGISWTPGEAQAARYDLSKQVNNIEWKPEHGKILVEINPKNGKQIGVYIDEKGNVAPNAGYDVHAKPYEGKPLTDIVGKELAEKIMSASKGNLEGEGLKIGGEGMKAFYDKMLVDKANALGKKFGSKVEQREIPGSIPKDWTNSDVYEKLYNAEKLPMPYMSFDKFSGWWNKFTPEGKARALKDAGIVAGEHKIHYLPLTTELRARAKQGFPLFSSTPITVPVDYDPFERKKYKLVPVEGNPFQ